MAKTCSAVLGSHHPSIVAGRTGLVATSLLKNRSNRVHTFAGTLVHRANQWASTDVCDKKAWELCAIMNYIHSAAAIAHKEGKSQDEKKRRKRLPRSAKEPHRLSKGPIPRRARTLPVRDATANFTCSGPILRCCEWNLAGTPCTLIKACQDGAVVSGGLRSTNRTGG